MKPLIFSSPLRLARSSASPAPSFLRFVLLGLVLFTSCVPDDPLVNPTPEALGQWLPLLEQDTITDLVDTKDYVWLTTKRNGLRKVSKKTLTLVDGPHTQVTWPDDALTSVVATNRNRLFIGTRNHGLARLGPEGLTRFDTHNSDLPNNEIRCLEMGQDGTLWIGTFAGLVAFRDGVFQTYHLHNSDLPDDNIRVIREDPGGNIWVGTQTGGLVQFDPTQSTLYQSTNSILVDNQIRFITFAADKMWTASFHHLYHLDAGGWQKYTAQNSDLSSNYVNDLEVDLLGAVYLATHEGLTIEREGEWTKYYNWNSGLLHNIVERVLVDERNNKWIGTYRGLVIYNEAGIKR